MVHIGFRSLKAVFILALSSLILYGIVTTFDGSRASRYQPPYVNHSQDPLYHSGNSYNRENATFVTLCRNEDLYSIIQSIKKVEDRFNNKFAYDWVFLNEVPFTDEFKERTSVLISGQAKYGLIPKEHWSYPDYIDQERAAESRRQLEDQQVVYGGLESYRHMCRFNSGFFYKHPLMLDYRYYWRVEPDIEILCDVETDLFRYMRENNKTYGFTISIHEFEKTIPTLWETTKEFMKQNPSYIAENNLMNFISDDNGKTYNLCHFWSNFEVADMDFWRSDVYEKYFKFLDDTGKFFYERWGDAPVHSLAVSLFLPKEKVHFFNEVGYKHSVYSMCPIDKDIWKNRKCYCDPKTDFTFRGYSCGRQYYKATGLTRPSNWKDYD
ncbi:alpha-1,2-mannosyltransferase KRE2 [Komagataella kurtzmanii]|nr:alpha-1,2-mannosyltransferase KRE2 [Komagataella kurtzmanii]